MKLGMGLKISTSLTITPQLQHAIKLLQMSTQELEVEIQINLEMNPLLELADEFDSISSDYNESDYDPRELSELDSKVLAEMGSDQVIDTDWEEVFSHQSTTLASPDEHFEDNQVYEVTLQAHLRAQLNLVPFTDIDKLIAECVIGYIDDQGYLLATSETILEVVNSLIAIGREKHTAPSQIDDIEINEVEVVIKRLQHFEPSGVCARNLPECLSRQLTDLHASNPAHIYSLSLLHHHQLLLSRDRTNLMRLANIPDSDTFDVAMRLLQSLNPFPGQSFNTSANTYQIADVVVTKKDNRWLVSLNPDALPKLKTNSYYSSLIKHGDQSADNQYLRQHLQEAKNFIGSIKERQNTLLKVATCIMQYQRDFLEGGVTAMKPLVLRQIAAETDFHESTISRITTNKFIHTPKGLFELRYFFSSHVATSTGGECSSVAIRAQIKSIIQQELPSKPLSDNAITSQLVASGLEISRRTVMKYREQMKIPASPERKRVF